MVVLNWDHNPPCACNQYIVLPCRKRKWRTLADKEEANDRLFGRGNNKRKYNKLRRKTPPRLRMIGTEEYTPLVSVNL